MNAPIFDAKAVTYRLEEAGKTLLCLPARGCRPAGHGNGWPQVVHAASEAYGWEAAQPKLPTPSAAAITRMDEAWAWLVLIPLCRSSRGAAEPWSNHGGSMLRRLVIARSLISPITERHLWTWRKIGTSFGISHEAARIWHGQAIDKIVGKLAQNGTRDTRYITSLPRSEIALTE